jgi:hypothetical protein
LLCPRSDDAMTGLICHSMSSSEVSNGVPTAITHRVRAARSPQAGWSQGLAEGTAPRHDEALFSKEYRAKTSDATRGQTLSDIGLLLLREAVESVLTQDR